MNSAHHWVRDWPRWLLYCGGCLLMTLKPWPAQAGAASLQPVPQIAFCQTAPSAKLEDCEWQAVQLPHRWSPAPHEQGWGVYRLRWPELPAGPIALLAQRLSLSGYVQSPTQEMVRPDYPSGTLLRYWPLAFVLEVQDPGPERGFEAMLHVHGAAAMKNGLGELQWGTESVVRAEQNRLQFQQVTVLMALSAASIMVGLLGLIPSHFRTAAGQMMFSTASLAMVAGLRIGLNLVTEPPMAWQTWSALNLSLLSAVSLLEISVLSLYLVKHPRWVLPIAGLTGLGLALAFLMLPDDAVYPLANIAFITFTMTVILLLLLLVRRLLRKPEMLGWGLLVVYASLLGLSLHDLWLHLSSASVSSGYLLIWLMPVLLMLMTALMMRHLEHQHQLENALKRETLQREDLLRDLHDGIGSRLVALAFHAGHIASASSLTEEIQALMRELQLIQGAVRTDPQTLGSVLADARHLYAQVGGGHLPLLWQIDESCASMTLHPGQVIALHRILGEAIANAVKHAHPGTIWLRLECADGPWQARLLIDNDGQGHFVHRTSGGLRNIQLRAQRAGLQFRAYEIDSLKRIEVCFARSASTNWRHKTGTAWRALWSAWDRKKP